jgi:hypothetical protein
MLDDIEHFYALKYVTPLTFPCVLAPASTKFGNYFQLSKPIMPPICGFVLMGAFSGLDIDPFLLFNPFPFWLGAFFLMKFRRVSLIRSCWTSYCKCVEFDVAFNLLILFKMMKLSLLRYIIVLSRRNVLVHWYLETTFVMPLVRDYSYLTLKMTNLDLETLILFKGDISIMFRSNPKLMLMGLA